jgi:hypothetical protein
MTQDKSEKIAQRIIAALDTLTYSPVVAARVLASAPGPIQHRLWLTVKALIQLWEIEARYGTFDPKNEEIYRWAERHKE